ncbi:MAG: hypothetical protein EBQ69_04295 [Betaproteobacteria bacterium]|nr:hypothetical protein [Betaproteobacteria bacterium]
MNLALTSLTAMNQASIFPMPLKIFRAPEDARSTISQSYAGRMVMSGRMDDICAELDRLSALENLGTSSTPQ